MPDEIRILGIAGSLRKESFNRYALRAATELVPAGASLDIFDRLGEFPPFNQDQDQSPPQVVVDLKAAIRAHDAILFVTPEYNYSLPGLLKNAIDWASRPYGDSAWAGKPAAVMGASIGRIGTARAQYHLRQCFVFLDMPTVNQPEVMIGSAKEAFDAAGRLTNESSKKLIGQLLAALVALTRRVRG
jgi:chromate reductase